MNWALVLDCAHWALTFYLLWAVDISGDCIDQLQADLVKRLHKESGIE